MTEIKLYKSGWRGIKLIIMTLPFVIIGIWIILEEEKGTFNYIMGWLCALFFGMGIPFGIFVLFDKKPQIIINDNGIWDRTIKQTEIKWEQINEAYLIDIYSQKFISIVVDETYQFQTEQYKWAEKLTEAIGAQKLNLNLGQLKVDENKLISLINKIKKAEKNDRNNLIETFLLTNKVNSVSDFQKYFLYFLITICLAIFSLNNYYVFWISIILMGVSALIARWYRGTTNNSKLRKYSERMTFVGLINMVLILFAFKIYDYTAAQTGIKIVTEIENYKTKYGAYPNDLKIVTDKIDLNPIQKYVVNKIGYKTNRKDYIIELEFLDHSKKVFDTELTEWNIDSN